VVEHKDVVIIGAGQAGLSLGYYLTQSERDYIILEQASEIVPAWRGRWDSFTLVLPNWTVQMPGFAYAGEDPDGFMERDELVEYFEQYAATFDPEIRFGQKVTAVEKNPNGDNFLVHTSESTIEADNVIVAAGTFQKPSIPACSQNISTDIVQCHTSEYHNPDALPEGAVLVVGTGQSGCQIAEELYQSGRKVYLCVGSATRIPRWYRGQDSIWWLVKTGFFDQTIDKLPSSKARFKANPFLSGKGGGRSLDLHQYARDGVVLMGHLRDAQENRIKLAPNLYENLAIVDQSVLDFKRAVDKYIDENHIEAEDAPLQDEMKDGYDSEIIEELDLRAEGIKTIIWATGYRFDFSWVKIPLWDEDGYPIQDRGVTEYPGLYFLGLHWLYQRKSGLLIGVGEVAAHIAKDIVARI